MRCFIPLVGRDIVHRKVFAPGRGGNHDSLGLSFRDFKLRIVISSLRDVVSPFFVGYARDPLQSLDRSVLAKKGLGERRELLMAHVLDRRVERPQRFEDLQIGLDLPLDRGRLIARHGPKVADQHLLFAASKEEEAPQRQYDPGDGGCGHRQKALGDQGQKEASSPRAAPVPSSRGLMRSKSLWRNSSTTARRSVSR